MTTQTPEVELEEQLDADPTLEGTIAEPVEVDNLAPPDLSVLDDPFASDATVEDLAPGSPHPALTAPPEELDRAPISREDGDTQPPPSLIGNAGGLAIIAGVTTVALAGAPPPVVVAVSTGCIAMLVLGFWRRSLRPLECRIDSLEHLRDFVQSLHDSRVQQLEAELEEKQTEIARLRGVLEKDDPGHEQSATVEESLDAIDRMEMRQEVERVERGDWTPNQEDVDPRNLVRSMVEARRDEARERGVKLTARVAARVCNATTDAAALEEITGVLLDHAVGRTPDHGHVSISTKMPNAKTGSTHTLCLRIKDSGPALDAEELEELFDATRDDAITIRRALARAHAGAMGGVLRAESEPGKGCTLIVELPVDTTAD